MNRRGKVLAISTVVAGIAVLVAAGAMAKDWIREEWWLHRLKYGDELDRQRAAERLGEIGSVRAVPDLAVALRGAVLDVMNRKRQNWAATHQFVPSLAPNKPLLSETGHWAYYRALNQFGQSALPGLIQNLANSRDADGPSSIFVAWTVAVIVYGRLLRISPQAEPSSPEAVSTFTPLATLDMLAHDNDLSQALP